MQNKTSKYPLEIAKIKNPTIQTTDNNAKQWELTYIVGRNRKFYHHLENILRVLYKVKYTLNIWTINPTPEYLPMRINNMCLQKDLYGNIKNSDV